MTPKRTMEEIVAILQAPTPLTEIRYLPKHVDQTDKTAMALPYFDARFTHARLDAACGPFGWQSDVKDIRGFVCVGIAILNPENATWVWRWDTGQEDQNEATGEADEDGDDEVKDVGGAKAIVSRGIKRAGVQFGIGRDIYDLPKVRCKVRLNNKGKAAGWDEDVASVIALRRQPQQRVPQPPATSASPEVSAATTEGTPQNGGSNRLLASNTFGEHAQKSGATREQIATAIAQARGADGKTDWTAAIPALDAIIKAAGTVPL